MFWKHSPNIDSTGVHCGKCTKCNKCPAFIVKSHKVMCSFCECGPVFHEELTTGKPSQIAEKYCARPFHDHKMEMQKGEGKY